MQNPSPQPEPQKSEQDGTLSRLRAAFARFVDWIAPLMPEELDDEANYGFPAHYIACREGCHPAVAKGLVDRLEQWGRGTKDVKELHQRVKPQLEALSPESYIAMLRENLVTFAPQAEARSRPRM